MVDQALGLLLTRQERHKEMFFNEQYSFKRKNREELSSIDEFDDEKLKRLRKPSFELPKCSNLEDQEEPQGSLKR